MSKPTFTPGPWHVRFPLDIEDAKGRHVAELYNSKDDPISRRTVAANAHLIAAAPEMYRTLEQISSGISQGGIIVVLDIDYEGIAAAIDTLLAKARGEQPQETP